MYGEILMPDNRKAAETPTFPALFLNIENYS